MSGIGAGWCNWRLLAAVFIAIVLAASVSVSAQQNLKHEAISGNKNEKLDLSNVTKSSHPRSRSGYKHVWPVIKFGWRIVVGTLVGFFGAACGSAGGVGGGGIFVPMLNLIVGFDAKSSAALSKCMVTGAAASTAFYNLRQRHPTLELPVIDYDLALLLQPMLVLGISVGVALNVIFADWMITVLLIVIFTFMSIKAFLKGVETWKKENKTKREAANSLELNGNGINQAEECEGNLESSSNDTTPKQTQEPKKLKVSIIENIYWKELGLLVAVWAVILALQIAKIPVAGGVSAYEAVALYKGQRKIASKGDVSTKWRAHQLVFYCACGIIAGVVGGMLGLGGGLILGPVLLELGIPPQVSSATATFAMTFSASMSVIEYYLLKRFPVPYVATIAAFVGQHVVKKLIDILGRASIIIFTLSFTIIVSALSLGGVGLAKMIKRIEHKEYMGFDNLCSYTA